MARIKEKDTAALEDGSVGDSVDRMQAFDDAKEQSLIEQPAGPDWLALARNNYEDSTNFVETSIRWQWERNLRAFQSRHPAGSKYLSEAYRHRTKLFRPKTRSMIRQMEAAGADAFFSNEDVVEVKPANDQDPVALASAEINKELLQYRLTTANPRIAIPWFVTVIGALQDSQVYGIVASKQWWEYEDTVRVQQVPMMDPLSGQPLINPETGEQFMQEQEVRHVIYDRPRVDLIAPENLRIDRGADWRDPINSSPYVIILHPMYIQDVEKRMRTVDRKTGQPQWKQVDRGRLKAAAQRHVWDATRTHREENRQDSKDSETAVDEFTMVWVHENIVRWDGEDYVYYTAGIHDMLSEPIPLGDVYKHCRNGNRPVVMGYALIETHKNYPDAKPQLTEALQAETNDLVNLRLDNIKLALGKTWKVKRGRNVDLRQLTRVVPGKVQLVSDPDDIEEMQTQDVTQGSFMEQDRINADYDEVAGNFSAGSVTTNRRMNETVGGMNMLSRSANLIGQLDLRVFTETWCEPVLRQIVHMEQAYESDETILALAAEKAQVYQKYGINTINDMLLERELTLRVNVGTGSTDPMQRLQKFLMAGEAVGKLLGEQVVQMIDVKEVIKEIFSAVGYRDGSRFFTFDREQDPQIMILQQQIQQLQQLLEGKVLEAEAKRDVAKYGAMSRIIQQYVENEGNLEEEQERARNDQRRMAVEDQRERGREAREDRREMVRGTRERQDAREGRRADYEKSFMEAMMRNAGQERQAQHRAAEARERAKQPAAAQSRSR